MERQDLFSSLRKDIEEFKILIDGIQGISSIPQGIKDLVNVKLEGMASTLSKIYASSENEMVQETEQVKEKIIELEHSNHVELDQEVEKILPKEEIEKELSSSVVEEVSEGSHVQEEVKSPIEEVEKEVLPEVQSVKTHEEPKIHKSINEQLSEGKKTVLDQNISEKRIADFHRKLSLNDMLRMQREIFMGDNSKMNEAFAKMAQMTSYQEVEDFFRNELKANIEEGIAKEYLQSIKSK